MTAILPELAEPTIIEAYGAPEFYISGTIVVFDGDVAHVICYVDRQFADRVERHEVLRCHMGASQYRQNLLMAFERMRLGRGH